MQYLQVYRAKSRDKLTLMDNDNILSKLIVIL